MFLLTAANEAKVARISHEAFRALFPLILTPPSRFVP